MERSAKQVRVLSLLGMILVVVLWGLAPLVGKYLFNESAYSPALLIACRGLLAAVVLGLFLLFTGRFKKVTKAYWICVPAGLIMGSAYLFQFIGLESTTLAKNTFLESFSIIAAPLTMVILTRKRPGWYNFVAAAICFFGCFVLCGKGWDFSLFFVAPTLGDIFSAIGGVLFGVNIAFTKVFAKDKDPYLYVFFQLAIMTVISFGYALPFERGLTFSWTPLHVLSLVFLGLVCTAGCWLLRTVCLKHVSAVTCAVLNPMSAVLATSLSILLAMEEFSWNVVIGGLIIVASILLSSLMEVCEEKRIGAIEMDQPSVSTK